MPEKTAYRLAAMAFGMRVIGSILAAYALFQAVILIFAHPDRFSSIGYSTALLIPGSPQTWGYFLGVAGIILCIGITKEMWRLASWGAFLASIWSMFFAITFFISSIEHGKASLTGIPTYLQNALIFAVLGVTLRRQRI